MVLFILLFVLAAIILRSWLNLVKDARSLSVPGPFPLPIVGNGHLLLGNSSGKFMQYFQLLPTHLFFVIIVMFFLLSISIVNIFIVNFELHIVHILALSLFQLW